MTIRPCEKTPGYCTETLMSGFAEFIRTIRDGNPYPRGKVGKLIVAQVRPMENKLAEG